uniref:Interleukin n=1 Tax=Esox lucius TaxID=8010 RepID=A0A3P8Z4B0_ESOLU
MKLTVCVFLAITCCVLANKDMQAKNRQTVMEVLTELRKLNISMEECCLRTAFECFRTSVSQLKINKSKIYLKFNKSLRIRLIVKCVPLFPQECQTCTSYPKKGSQEFLGQLESLLQKVPV